MHLPHNHSVREVFPLVPDVLPQERDLLLQGLERQSSVSLRAAVLPHPGLTGRVQHLIRIRQHLLLDLGLDLRHDLLAPLHRLLDLLFHGGDLSAGEVVVLAQALDLGGLPARPLLPLALDVRNGDAHLPMSPAELVELELVLLGLLMDTLALRLLRVDLADQALHLDLRPADRVLKRVPGFAQHLAKVADENSVLLVHRYHPLLRLCVQVATAGQFLRIHLVPQCGMQCTSQGVVQLVRGA
mmetsp:Transcript_122591/g.392359  ORF Transcript_122591/g.392359 Transcript_122591/m.392359 type:complete len:242 (+) Transcript_122591:4127-4852(+)